MSVPPSDEDASDMLRSLQAEDVRQGGGDGAPSLLGCSAYNLSCWLRKDTAAQMSPIELSCALKVGARCSSLEGKIQTKYLKHCPDIHLRCHEASPAWVSASPCDAAVVAVACPWAQTYVSADGVASTARRCPPVADTTQ
jgi:hypothetical protein